MMKTIIQLLVIDDDPMLWTMLQEMLDEQVFQMRFASNGREGVAAIDEQTPDLVLLDVLMPVMSGFDCLKMLRADPRTQNLPVIMLTANEDADSIQNAFEYGATDFIPKPIHWPMLAHRLRYVFRTSNDYNRLLDIERQQTRIIQASEQRFRQMADGSPIMIWTTDAQGVLTFANRALLEFIGVNRLDVLSSTEWRKIFQLNGAELFTGNDEIVKTSSEYCFHRSAGDIRWVLHQGSLLRNAHDEVTGYVGSLTDITERKKEQQLLQDLERQKAQVVHTRLMTHIEASPDFVGFADANTTRILYINRAGRKMTGIGEHDDVTELKISDVHPARLPNV